MIPLRPLAHLRFPVEQGRGRRYPELPHPYRNPFQRDRDRIVHSNAFRRLVYKTQVFVNHEGDLYRTRLTHSMEVAQIARSIARALQLNEALTEAICLAHDLGHTPFGHAGQDALTECLRDYGGFEHNLQSLRIVDELEEFADAVRGKATPEMDGAKSTRSLAVLLAGVQSAREGRRVEISEVLAAKK